jgi:hypothetical protein
LCLPLSLGRGSMVAMQRGLRLTAPAVQCAAKAEMLGRILGERVKKALAQPIIKRPLSLDRRLGAVRS